MAQMIGIPNIQMQGTPNLAGVRLAYMANWNQRLKARREALGMSSAVFARRVGVKPPTVFEWENEQTKNLKAKNLLKIATVLGVTPDWLLTGKGAAALDMPTPGATTSETEISADVLELARLLMTLTPPQREALMAVAETYRTVRAAARSSITKKDDQDVKRPLPARRRGTRQPAESK